MQNSWSSLATTSRRLVGLVLGLGGNRLELLLVELCEERERLVLAVVLATASASFVLLTGVALTIGLVLLFPHLAAIVALAVLAPIYGLVAAGLGLWLRRLCRGWQSFPATVEQLRRDREWLSRTLN